MTLLDKQHITFEDFLVVADFPKKELLLSKVKERMEQEQTLQQVQAQLQELQNQNIQLKGLIDSGLVAGEEKKVFDVAAKQALLNQLMQHAAPAPEMNGNPGAPQGQPENQGNM